MNWLILYMILSCMLCINCNRYICIGTINGNTHGRNDYCLIMAITTPTHFQGGDGGGKQEYCLKEITHRNHSETGLIHVLRLSTSESYFCE